MSVLRTPEVTISLYNQSSDVPENTISNLISLTLQNGEGDRTNTAVFRFYDPGLKLHRFYRNKSLKIGGIAIPSDLLQSSDETSTQADDVKKAPTPYNVTGQLKGDDLVNVIIKYCQENNVPKAEHIAYVLATAQHESGMGQYYKEIGDTAYFSDNYDYRSDLGNDAAGDGAKYAGRGLVQITGKRNYKLFGDILGIDLITEPELAEQTKYAVPILVLGMRDGLFTGAKLSDFDSPFQEFDAIEARRIVNGTDRAELIRGYYNDWLKCLKEKKGFTNIEPNTIGTVTVDYSSNTTITNAELSVVAIQQTNGLYASGFIVSSNATETIIVTCEHVQDSASGVVLLQDSRKFNVSWIASTESTDLAIGKLLTNGAVLPTVKLGSDDAAKGDQVVAIGMRLGQPNWARSVAFIEDLEVKCGLDGTQCTESSVNFLIGGNSGCPVWLDNENNVVVGVAARINQTNSYFIPVSKVREYLTANDIELTESSGQTTETTTPSVPDESILVRFDLSYNDQASNVSYTMWLTGETADSETETTEFRCKGIKSILYNSERRRRVWRNHNANQVLQKLGDENKVVTTVSSAPQQAKPILVQNGETDLEFLNRVALGAGLTTTERNGTLALTEVKRANTKITLSSKYILETSEDADSKRKLTTLPAIDTIPDGTAIGEGFQGTLKIPYPSFADLSIQAGSILTLTGMGKPYDRDYRVKYTRVSYQGGYSLEIGLYLPVSLNSDAQPTTEPGSENPPGSQPSFQRFEGSNDGQYIIPGIPGKVKLTDPVIVNGFIKWDDATHGGERIPSDESITLNIIDIAGKFESIVLPLLNPDRTKIHINSMYRDPASNAAVGGAPQSVHLSGGAIDFYDETKTTDQVYDLLNPVWNGGLGKYTNGSSHVDNGSNRRWSL